MAAHAQSAGHARSQATVHQVRKRPQIVSRVDVLRRRYDARPRRKERLHARARKGVREDRPQHGSATPSLPRALSLSTDRPTDATGRVPQPNSSHQNSLFRVSARDRASNVDSSAGVARAPRASGLRARLESRYKDGVASFEGGPHLNPSGISKSSCSRRRERACFDEGFDAVRVCVDLRSRRGGAGCGGRPRRAARRAAARATT